jgi:hypothetical protein
LSKFAAVSPLFDICVTVDQCLLELANCMVHEICKTKSASPAWKLARPNTGSEADA